MAESYESTPDRISTAQHQTPEEAEESFLALVRALRAIRATGAAEKRRRQPHGGGEPSARATPASPAP